MMDSRLSVWPPLPPDVYLRRPRAELPYPLGDPTTRLFAWGRHALWHGLAANGLGAGDEVLVPAYHHGSEVEALVRAGITSRFFDVGANLEPNEAELETLVGPRVRALYLIHYLGFPLDAARWRRWCNDRNLLLIEDAAQAWLASLHGRPVGSYGDFAIFCLYKTFGLPEGGALVGQTPPSGAPADSRLGLAPLVRLHGAWIAQRSAIASELRDRWRGPPPESTFDPHMAFALREPAGTVWASVGPLLSRISDQRAAERRRANYRSLLAELAPDVPPPFGELPEGASPWAFPIRVVDKQATMSRLAERGITALDFWSQGHPSLPAGFPGASSRRSQTVGLPVHQELRHADLERIVTGALASAARPRPRVRYSLERLDDLDAGRTEWSELALRSRNIFSTWEWASTWWCHFGAEESLMACLARRSDGSALAIFPLCVSRAGPLRVARFVGYGPSDRLGPICARANGAAAARALRRTVAASSEFDLFVGDHLPAEDEWSLMVGGRPLRSIESPVLKTDDRTWEDFLATRSTNLRGQVRRRERTLARDHELTYRLSRDPGRLGQDLDILFDLHRARWAQEGVSSTGFTRREAFHREFAAVALALGWLRLWIMEVDGRPVAAWYGFRFGEVDAYYQAGRDPAWDRRSVGFALLAHSIRATFEDRMREYRFLRGGEAYKLRFADGRSSVDTIAIGRTVVGRAMVSTAAGARRCRDMTRAD